jgi:peptide/nickel transport system substrate-binding protein
MVASVLLAACGEDATATPEPVIQEATDAPAPTEAAPTEAPTEEPTEVPTEEPEAAGEPNILTVRIPSDMMDLDPAFIPQNVDSDIAENIYSALIRYPGSYDEYVEDIIAEPLEVSEDGLSVSFTLREGVQFHKGYGELTAEDVKYSYERFLDPDLDPPYRDDWAALDHVEVTGKYTGVIILKEAFAPLWTSTLPATAGWIVSKKAMEEMGHDEHATNPIGSGPYQFEEWVPNQRVVLTRFEDYWGEPPEWDEIDFLVIVEDSAAEIALESGELDFAQIGTDAVERFEANPDFDVYSVATPNYNWIAMNVQHPNLEDVNVRRAIRAGIDVNSIIEVAYDGKYERACAMIAPSLLGYWPDAPCYERDVEQAKEYLAAAGLETLDITLTYENTAANGATAEVVQANLAEVGINVELIPEDGALFWEEGYGEQGAEVRQLAVMAYATNPDPAWVTVWFTCAQVQEWNWMYWCSEEYDQLHEQGMTEMDQDERGEIYIRMQQLMDEAAHSVWVAYPTNFWVAKAGLVPSVTPGGYFIPWRFTTE